MRIIAKGPLRDFWARHPDSEQPLLAWYREVKAEAWDTTAKLKARYPRASIVPGNRAVFRFKGGTYRLVVRINYLKRIVYIRFIGTHAEYDRIDATEV